MMQQYLAGELSVLLARLPAIATNRESMDAGVHLRQVAETVPVAVLPSVIVGALDLIEGLCWASLRQGDVSAFGRQAGLAVELHEFAVCSSLLRDD
jgi:hypothetical protein